MLNIVIHIGQEKTGTTALQHMISDNGDAFRPQIHYPHRDDGNPHHYKLFRALEEDDGATGQAMLSEMISQTPASADTVLFSAEHFSWPTKGRTALDRFLATASAFDVKLRVIVSIRDGFGYMKSLYGEALKWGQSEAFSTFVVSRRTWLKTDWMIGTASAHGADIDFLRYSGEAQVRNFFELVHPGAGQIATELETERRSNALLSNRALLVLRKFNKLAKSKDATRKLVTILGQLPSDNPSEDEGSDSIFHLNIAAAKLIMQAEWNDEVRRRFFIDDERLIRISA